MMEYRVSLASSGAVSVPGYGQLTLGYTRNRGVYQLCVSASGEWEGLTIRAFWHVPGGSDPASSLVVDGCVEVPASVTAQPGFGCITFEGTDGTRTLTSADLRYRVGANSGTEEGTAPEPGTDSWQQFVEAARGDADRAEQAKAGSEAAAKQALEAATTAKDSADASARSAGAAAASAGDADRSAQASDASAQEAARQAGLAAQAAEGKGYLYLDDQDNSGVLSLIIADSISEEVSLRDNGAGILEVILE